jgi:thiamine kinase-like enzyme
VRDNSDSVARVRPATGPALEDVIARIPGWQGRELHPEILKGGLSHVTYRVHVDGKDYVVRLMNQEIDRYLLGICPEDEIANTIIAAETGVCPAVIAAFPELPAMVLEYIDGRTFHLDDVQDPRNIPRIGRACRLLHERARPFVNPFDIFRHLQGFLGICRRHGVRTPDGYASYLPVVARIEDALAVGAGAPASCHNDLLAENIMDDGKSIRIIDFQLSGLHDRCFELGDLAAEGDFTPDDVERLCESYFGERLPDRVARSRLYLIMSNLTWTLWFSVHEGLIEQNPDVEFDYWAEALDKWGQAVRDLESPELGSLLEQARRASA